MHRIGALVPTSLVLLALVACSNEEDACKPACGPGESCVAGACTPTGGGLDASLGGTDASTGGQDAGMGAPDAAAPTLVSIELDPAESVLTSVNGSTPSQSFTVRGHWSDGSTTTIVDATMSVEPVTLGSFMAGTTTFVSNGRVAGDGRIVATRSGIRGEAAIRIEIDQQILLPGTPTTAPNIFEVTPIDDPTRSADVVYPLDGAVMPQNVQPAEIQWSRSAPGDLFRVRLVKPNVRVATFLAVADAAFTDSLVPELVAWRRIAESEPDADAEIHVDRWEAATQQVISSPPVKVRFAKAALLGSVYYWDIVAGRIVRIDDATGARDAFMPNPPLGCVGCHSVSTSGRLMAGRFGGGDNVASVFDLTQDLTGNPPPTVFPVADSIRWWFSTWSPDDSRLLVTKEEAGIGHLVLLDPTTGLEVTPASGPLPTDRATHPAWSPDGSAIAYVANNDAWGGANTTGDLFILPVIGADTFGTPARILDGTMVAGTPAGNAASYPSWSPDSALLAFAHGNSSRSENGLSALYLVRRDGTGVVRLDRASGGVDTAHSFQPRFSPFHQGGYFWLSFLSRRDYGNAKAGTAGSGRQQIWVTAIKENPQPGEDPSAVGYWLPGQDTHSLNISAFWAQRACRAVPETCTVDAECCTGSCSDSGTCEELTACKTLGESCTDSTQCCNGVLCVDRTCGSL